MTTIKTALLGASLALCLTGIAHAADYAEVPFGAQGPAGGEPNYLPTDEGGGQRWREGGDLGRWGHRPHWDEGRFYGRPVPGWGRPVAERRWWRGRGEDCRIIVKRRMTPWGDVRVRRIEICE